jgi:carboxypeptidase family protein
VASRISGVALNGQGRPMAGANVFLTQRVAMQFVGNAQVRADGSFTIGGVTPGDYTLRAAVPAVPDETATADVTVSGGDVTNVQLVGVKPSTLRGRVLFEAGDVKPPALSAVRLIVTPSVMASGSGNPKDDATFDLKTTAGHRQIRATVIGTGDWSLSRVLTADGIDVIDTGLDVPVNAAIEGLVVAMTSRHTELSGTVVDAAGARVRDCVVVAFAQDAQRWAAQTRYFGTSRPGQDSVFKMRVPPGDYYVAAFEEPDTSVPLNDPEILHQLRERAMKFSIADGEKRTLEVLLGQPPIY